MDSCALRVIALILVIALMPLSARAASCGKGGETVKHFYNKMYGYGGYIRAEPQPVQVFDPGWSNYIIDRAQRMPHAIAGYKRPGEPPVEYDADQVVVVYYLLDDAIDIFYAKNGCMLYSHKAVDYMPGIVHQLVKLSTLTQALVRRFGSAAWNLEPVERP